MLEGPNWSCLTACAASSQSIGEATEIIRGGEADRPAESLRQDALSGPHDPRMINRFLLRL